MTSIFNTRGFLPFKTDPSVRPVPGLGWWTGRGFSKTAPTEIPAWAAGDFSQPGNITTPASMGGTGAEVAARNGFGASLKPTGPQFQSDGSLAGGGYPVGSSQNPQLEDAIGGLLTPGLVPDIARQSAEVSAGRGVAGSPAAGSTGVRMSEQNWLQRLGLANTLLSGEASRNLPYQVTPYQQKLLDLQLFALQNRMFGNPLWYGTPGVTYGRSGRGGIGVPSGGRGVPTSTGGYTGMNFGFGGGTTPGGSVYGGSGFGGGGGGLGDAWTLDDTYEWLGFGNFGSQPGDTTSPPTMPPDFDWEMWE